MLIENLEFSNFSGEKGPVVVENLWPQVENIRFTSNTFDGLWISGALVVGDEKIGDGWPVALQNVKILPSASLTIDSGSHIFMPLASSLEVEGRLDANGTFDRPIRVETMEGVSNWGYWLFKNSISHLSFVNFLGGNYLPTKPKKRDGVLIIEDSSVVLNHCSIINGRAPGNSILSTESNLTIYSTWIGHTEEPLFETSGVRIKGGTLILDNVWFSNLEYGIYGLTGDMGLPFLEMYNMNPDHFINIENLWSPNYWLSPLLSMPEIIINN